MAKNSAAEVHEDEVDEVVGTKVIDPKAARKRIQGLTAEISLHAYEREDVIRQMLMTFLRRGHGILLGVPGVAKSFVIRLFLKGFRDAKLYKYLLGKFTVPEEVWGPWSIKGLENDTMERILRGKAAEAHFWFLDEIFKSTSELLNTLLTGLEERLFVNGDDEIKVPLISCWGASNELPNDTEITALRDRFDFMTPVFRIRDLNIRRKFIEGGAREKNDLNRIVIESEVRLAELRAAQRDVKRVKIPGNVLDKFEEILQEVEKKVAISVSDRRMNKMVRMIKPRAWIDEKDEAAIEHLDFMTDMLWEQPGQRAAVQSIVMKHANPVLEDLASIKEATKDAYETVLDLLDDNGKIPDDKAQDVFAQHQVTKNMINKIERLAANHPEHAKAIDEAMKAVRPQHDEIVNRIMNRDPKKGGAR